MASRDEIIEKIKKCLALGKSANEHEAAAALRQAQKLMRQHGISDFDIETADIVEEATKAGAAHQPARWEFGLATCAARAFDCAVFLQAARPIGSWIFVEAVPAAQIARYAFEVLFRQVKRARADYIKTKLKRCGPTNRTRRADIFCEGWILAATHLIDAFAGNQVQQAKVKAYLEAKPRLQQFTGRNRSKGRSLTERDYGDLAAGQDTGKGAQLNRGVAGAAPLALT